jgi:hypothetical protein
MNLSLSFDQLMEHTEWERGKWHSWFQQQGAKILEISAGPWRWPLSKHRRSRAAYLWRRKAVHRAALRSAGEATD